MTSIRITADDRDAQGNILLPSELRARQEVAEATTVVVPRPDTAAREVAPNERRPIAPPATAPARTGSGVSKETLFIMVGALLLVSMIIGVSSRLQPSRAQRPLPASALVPTIAAPSAGPSTTPIPRIARAVAVFAAPNGDALGAIDAGRAYTVTARFGTAWVQLDAAESGRVWVRAADLPEQALGGLADLAPPPTDTPAPRAAPVYAPAPQAPAYVPQQPVGPTTDTRPVSCVKTLAGERCERGLDEHDQAVAAEIEATAAAYNAPFQAQTNATATAFAMPTPRTKDP